MATIEAWSADRVVEEIGALIALLTDVVDAGASIGFMQPLAAEEARGYWQKVATDVGAGLRVLLVAHDNGVLLGSAQLGLEPRPNGAHRAEVQKVMVHTAARRRGLGRALMAVLESEARAHLRSLLVLDTREGDAAEGLYQGFGYTRVGVIPRYALNTNGQRDGTVIYYKELSEI
jgi:ribosomal protein S18 acetylase RimI-like enzyme